MFSKTISRVILLCTLQILSINCYSGNSLVAKENRGNRQKRTLNFYFPYNSCYALAVVLSLPLEDTPAGRSVFCSYNFETNFYYPYFDNAAGIVPLPFTHILEPGSNAGTKHRIDLPPAFRQFNDDGEGKQIENSGEKLAKEGEQIQPLDDNAKHRNGTNPLNERRNNKTTKKPKSGTKKTKNKSRKVRSPFDNFFMSRRRFYKFLESEMDRSGLQGNDCILKAICETSQTKFGLNNGVIGSVVDVLFVPSASKDEKLPNRYYQAEKNGKSGDCDLYSKKCPKGIFDLISKII